MDTAKQLSELTGSALTDCTRPVTTFAVGRRCWRRTGTRSKLLNENEDKRRHKTLTLVSLHAEGLVVDKLGIQVQIGLLVRVHDLN